ncbi:alanine racemase [Kiloniella laminariae]|uniref:Alanine racemase n=1 Tax=Kiloniella laminariae TaxID=454162 RepID=A0ABT4LGL6_9PROT|nr:alanine racemase [Kiloniella laminariae]MCZ4280256.1 alanine racemase [Kiloniella laminariae]
MESIQGTCPELIVDLEAVISNYRTLKATVLGDCAAVLKANAYGLGSEKIAQALYDEGCRTFFVALTREGIELRSQFPAARIFVLSPFITIDGALLQENSLIPCLYDLEGIRNWTNLHEKPAPAALHFETGINRLGIQEKELSFLLKDKKDLAKLDLRLIMSHLSCADRLASAENSRQLAAFRRIIKNFPAVPASLANTAGTLLGSKYHFDLVRPGIGLYGHDPHYFEKGQSRLQTVVSFRAPLMQIKQVEAGEAVGYGATPVHKSTRLGVILCGYADGMMRALFKPLSGESHQVTVNGYKAPIIGRVSMDMITIDLTDLPATACSTGDMVEIFGPNSLVEDAAAMAGTSAYELFTRVSDRAIRKYI